MRVIQDAFGKYLSYFDEEISKSTSIFRINKGDEELTYDTFDEFIVEYGSADGYMIYHSFGEEDFTIYGEDKGCVSISVRNKDRSKIESIFKIFESDLKNSVIVTDKDPIKIFIGHGRNQEWISLKNHLQDQHGLSVVAYEIGNRAGLSVKEVLEKMLNESTFALLILTGEDEDNEGNLHARENVIHELGLFQGKLGFTRAIAIVENSIDIFSNISGVTQLRFNKNNIKETFGDIIATIKREFQE